MMMENHLSSINELKRKVDELTTQADEASSLRDQLEEYRHTTEKMSRMENTLEKYKRKMEESSDLKRQIKVHKRIILHTFFFFLLNLLCRRWKIKIQVCLNVVIK